MFVIRTAALDAFDDAAINSWINQLERELPPIVGNVQSIDGVPLDDLVSTLIEDGLRLGFESTSTLGWFVKANLYIASRPMIDPKRRQIFGTTIHQHLWPIVRRIKFAEQHCLSKI
jgi:hypothetical protein